MRALHRKGADLWQVLSCDAERRHDNLVGRRHGALVAIDEKRNSVVMVERAQRFSRLCNLGGRVGASARDHVYALINRQGRQRGQLSVKVQDFGLQKGLGLAGELFDKPVRDLLATPAARQGFFASRVEDAEVCD